mgnify:CR=1 FL=1
MKPLITSAALLAVSVPAFGQWAVIDAANLQQAAVNYAALVEQLSNQATQISIDRPVAFKVQKGAPHPDLVERFRSEARLLGKLRAHAPALVETGDDAHGPFLVMEAIAHAPARRIRHSRRDVVERRVDVPVVEHPVAERADHALVEMPGSGRRTGQARRHLDRCRPERLDLARPAVQHR